jgi:hypothetical protein
MVVDSEGSAGSPLALPGSTLSLQFLQCSRSLVPQTGQVNAASKELVPSSLLPTIQKNTSRWQAFVPLPTNHDSGTTLLEREYVTLRV